MFIEGPEPVQSVGSEAEYAQLRSVNPSVIAEIAEPLKITEGVLVQHYPDVSDAGVRVQLGRQYREVGSKIEWPSSYKGRTYLQSNTGDSYLIVGNTFYDLSASEVAGEPVHCQLDPDVTMRTDLIGNTLEYLRGRTTGTIEMVEVSQGFSDAQGAHLDNYELAGVDPFEKFNQRFEQVGVEDELPISEASLLTDFRTYPPREPRGLRARARQMISKAGLAGKALLAEVREQVQASEHERKYTRRRAALIAAIGVAAIGGGMALATTQRGPSKPGKALIAPPRSAETVTARTGDNPWEISESQFVHHGIAHPGGPEVTEYDDLFLASNFPHANNLDQAAQHITPGDRYVLPTFDFQEFKR
jgi:hypothetical protein